MQRPEQKTPPAGARGRAVYLGLPRKAGIAVAFETPRATRTLSSVIDTARKNLTPEGFKDAWAEGTPKGAGTPRRNPRPAREAPSVRVGELDYSL
jgi:hypothetical protein